MTTFFLIIRGEVVEAVVVEVVEDSGALVAMGLANEIVEMELTDALVVVVSMVA